MALNFPNNPSTGQEHTGVNGIVYRYDGEKWITLGAANVGGSPTFDSLAVNGSASFASGGTTIDGPSGVTVTSSSGAKNQLNGDGFYQIKTDGSTSAATILANGSATFDGVLQGNQRVIANGGGGKTGTAATFLNYAGDASTVTASITADGSASFAGQIQGGNNTTAFGGVFYSNSSDPTYATLYARNYDQSGTGNVIRCENPTGGIAFQVNADGSATFANTVESPSFYGNATGTAQVWYGGNTGTSVIKADGSAEFAGTVTVGAYSAFGTGLGVRTSANGSLSLNRPNDTAAPALQISQIGSTDIKTQLKNDGSATFAGTLRVNHSGSGFFGTDGDSLSLGDSGGTKVSIQSTTGAATFAGGVTAGGDCIIETGSLNVYQASNSNAATVFNGGWNTGGGRNITSTIYSDGSAEFGSAPNNSNATGVSFLSANGAIAVQANGRLFRGHAYSNGAQTSVINDDGSATFSGNITAGNVSDIKFKENITDANPQLADVTALGSSLKNWDWKEEAPLNDELKSKRFLGLIAQEAEQICPGLTYEVGEGEDSYKAINHDILVMKLLGAVAELKAEVEALKG
jgi:hypothetical protein